MQNQNINPKPEEIYYRVLQIGSECLSCGITFNDLKQRLEGEGYVFKEEECLNRCLREWFYHSFFHEEAQCNGTHNNVRELDNHLGCRFVLNSDSCMKLLTFRAAENNRLAAGDNLKSVKTANKIAYLGLGIALFALLKGTFIDENPNKHLQAIQTKLDTVSTQLPFEASKFLNKQTLFQDSLYKILNAPLYHAKDYKVGSQQGKDKLSSQKNKEEI